MTIRRVVHTAHLTPTELAQIRDLLDRAFAGRFDDADWDHTLGGLHMLLAEDNQLIAHAAVVQRQFVHDGRPIRTGYVEALAVDPNRRGRGHARSVMGEVERVIRVAYLLGALSAAHGVQNLYVTRGWLAWRGQTYVLSPTGMRRTPDDDDSTFVLPVSPRHPIAVTGTLACDWRGGEVW